MREGEGGGKEEGRRENHYIITTRQPIEMIYSIGVRPGIMQNLSHV